MPVWIQTEILEKVQKEKTLLDLYSKESNDKSEELQINWLKLARQEWKLIYKQKKKDDLWQFHLLLSLGKRKRESGLEAVR